MSEYIFVTNIFEYSNIRIFEYIRHTLIWAIWAEASLLSKNLRRLGWGKKQAGGEDGLHLFFPKIHKSRSATRNVINRGGLNRHQTLCQQPPRCQHGAQLGGHWPLWPMMLRSERGLQS